ncbi:helix-turn-helix domain-containing protein [Morganella sp. GD04133]|uniref:helix-turn-helix domain-containing protein n=1 Tax=Morganella sp. GD04133 TaxID=2975435 RepID=UPI00244BBD1C|nr:helix-turn-helix domain-containing protein [Morganella sp. GD04133]MDH0357151.1 helix-turn-helix domain-containing protein [Morganella sp. GD04133]
MKLTHEQLFTIPEISHSTEIATIKPLPKQEKITGDKQVDAYLWVLRVIALNEPAHLEKAEKALDKIKISPKEAQDKYTKYLQESGAHPFQIVFGTMGIDSPESKIKSAREAIEKARQVRGIFGDYDSAFGDTPAEVIIKSSPNYIDDPYYGWTKKEIKQGWKSGDSNLEKEKEDKAKGFTDVLPDPETLSDVIRELEYWGWLYQMRSSAEKEMGYQYSGDQPEHVYFREHWLEIRLQVIQPTDREEAKYVWHWLKNNDRFDGYPERDDIIDNLVDYSSLNN